jgi:hypothetical protein
METRYGEIKKMELPDAQRAFPASAITKHLGNGTGVTYDGLDLLRAAAMSQPTLRATEVMLDWTKLLFKHPAVASNTLSIT